MSIDACHCEPVRRLVWQSPGTSENYRTAHTGVAPSRDFLRSQSPGSSESYRVTLVIANQRRNAGVAIRFPKPSPEKSGAPRANQNRNDCKCQSYLNVAQTGVVIRIPKPSLPGKVEWRGRERSHRQNSWTMFTSSTRAIYCQGTPHFAVCLGIFQSSARISSFGLAPMDFFTTWPFWKTSSVGMLAIR